MRRVFPLLLMILIVNPGEAQEFWERTELTAGRLPASALAISSEGTIFVGGLDGNLYRSGDDGKSWTRIETQWPLAGPIQSIAMTPDDHVFAILADGDILRSLDHGERWSRIQANPIGPNAIAASLHADVQGMLYATGALTIAHSKDRGETWSQINANAITTDDTITKIFSSPGKGVFVGTSSGWVFRFGVNGQKWTGQQVADSSIRSFAVASNGDIFCGIFGSGVFKSSDYGASWQPVNDGLSNPYVLSLCPDLRGGLLAGVSGGAIFYFTDGGQTWRQVHSVPNAYGVWDIAVNFRGDIFAATDAGVVRYNANDDQWAPTGLVEAAVRTLASNAGSDIFAATFGSGILRSSDDGQSWTAVNSGLTPVSVLSLLVNANGDIFAGTVFGGVYRSTDNGENWNNVSPLSPLRPAVFQTIGALAIDSSNVLYAGTRDFLNTNTLSGIYYSPNEGQNWIKSAFSGDVSAIAVDDTGFVYTGLKVRGGSGVRRKTFSSPDSIWAAYWWRDRSGWFSPSLDGIPGDAFSIAFGDSQVCAAAFDGGLFRLSDTTWTQINEGITDTVALSITIKESSIFAGTFGGSIFRSDDEGETWMLSNPGMTNKPVTSLLVSSSGRILAGTNGDGVFRSAIITSVRPTGSSPPRTFNLSQNYPNPFNPTTTIEYQLQSRDAVELAIYNQLGQRVKTVVNETQRAGLHQARWDGRNEAGESVASGLYLYRLKVADFTLVRKMVLLR